MCISSYMPRLENSAGPSHPRLQTERRFVFVFSVCWLVSRQCHNILTIFCLERMILCCLRCTLQPSATGTSSFRSDTSTSGSTVSPAACMILCVRFTCFVRKNLLPLRHRRNTRYGWAANPFPTGTCTLQDAPSFAWRAHVSTTGKLLLF